MTQAKIIDFHLHRFAEDAAHFADAGLFCRSSNRPARLAPMIRHLHKRDITADRVGRIASFRFGAISTRDTGGAGDLLISDNRRLKPNKNRTTVFIRCLEEIAQRHHV